MSGSWTRRIVYAGLAALTIAVGGIQSCRSERKVEEITAQAPARSPGAGCSEGLAGIVNGYSLPSHVAQYLIDNIPHALALEAEWDIPAAAALAKAGSEHDFGKERSLVGPANNHFGIKRNSQFARLHPECYTKETWEVTPSNKEDACFVVYPDAAASYMDFGRFLATREIGGKNPYADVMRSTDDAQGFLRALAKSPYSTNPKEEKLTLGILRAYHLEEIVKKAKQECGTPAPGPAATGDRATAPSPAPSRAPQGDERGVSAADIQSRKLAATSQYELTLHSTGFVQGDLIVAELSPREGALRGKDITLTYEVRTASGGKRKLVLPKVERDGKTYALLGTDFRYPAQDTSLTVTVEGARGKPYSVPIGKAQFTIDRSFSAGNTKNAAPTSAADKRSQARENRLLLPSWEPITKEAYFTQGFELPRPACDSTSYGERRFYDGVEKSSHKGMDCAGGRGDPIQAPLPGRVALVEKGFFYMGDTTVIDNGRGLYTLLAHQSAQDVRKGQVVQRGQRVGKVGNTGRVSSANGTGDHLHWQVKLYGMDVRPDSLRTINYVFGKR